MRVACSSRRPTGAARGAPRAPAHTAKTRASHAVVCMTRAMHMNLRSGRAAKGRFADTSVSAIDLVKMREAARVPATAPQRDERPSSPLQAGRANMMTCTRSCAALRRRLPRLRLQSQRAFRSLRLVTTRSTTLRSLVHPRPRRTHTPPRWPPDPPGRASAAPGVCEQLTALDNKVGAHAPIVPR